MSSPALFTPEYFANPYPTYEALRRADPVHYHAEMGIWILTRHADIVAAIRDPRLSSAWPAPFIDRLPEATRAALAPLRNAISQVVGFMDPPDHGRLRRLMNKAFTPRVVEGMRASIQGTVDRILDAAEASGGLDVVRGLAAPLPLAIIASFLGLSSEGLEKSKEASDDLMAFFGGGRPSPDLAVRAQAGILVLMEQFRALAEERRRAPKDDLFGALLEAHEGEDHITEDELLANCANLLFSGHETTTNLMVNGVLAFLEHPEQMRRLREDPTLIVPAVDECLRYDGPILLMPRLAADDLELGGKRIGRGQPVLLGIGAANRDPEQFPDPDRFDIGRSTSGQLGFGTGHHVCIGSPLARLENQIAIGTLIRRFPGLRLAEPRLEWHPVASFRAVKSLRVLVA